MNIQEKLLLGLEHRPEDFEFQGKTIDLGSSIGRCVCGHKIRYEYYVVDKKSRQEKILGSECIDNHTFLTHIKWKVREFLTDQKKEQFASLLKEYEELRGKVNSLYSSSLNLEIGSIRFAIIKKIFLDKSYKFKPNGKIEIDLGKVNRVIDRIKNELDRYLLLETNYGGVQDGQKENNQKYQAS